MNIYFNYFHSLLLTLSNHFGFTFFERWLMLELSCIIYFGYSCRQFTLFEENKASSFCLALSFHPLSILNLETKKLSFLVSSRPDSRVSEGPSPRKKRDEVTALRTHYHVEVGNWG